MLSLAPMEGLTDQVFRTVHAECFGPLDRYYTPFLTPPPPGRPFFERYRREIDPRANRGLDVVPQLLTKSADDFVWAAHLLAEMGYREVNLNLGCPSKIVMAKGKGSGFLRNLKDLRAFLDTVCEQSPLPVSVKTRLGIRDDGEYEEILGLYCTFPLAELIVHPRVQADRYQGKPRWGRYGMTLARAPFPVAYNGDVFGLDDLRALHEAYPQTRHVMLGRGILANPALVRMARKGKPATSDELRHFHDRLYDENRAIIGGKAMYRMKEWWYYARFSFASPDAVHRAIRTVRSAIEYEAAVDRVFHDEQLAAEALFRPTTPA